jgi:16S rRNA (cytidine1402-2'-O)-methyltransferase
MGELSIVATPLGNLQDITTRGLKVLQAVDYIACEDTRVTAKLLAAYQISKPLLSYYQHSRLSQVNKIIDLLKQGKNIALVTDAGTPGIADPGGQLVAQVVAQEIKVVAIPGPSAVAAVLSIAGLPADEFHFFGFLPHKKGRQTKLRAVVACSVTAVLYESVYRIEKFLRELVDQGIGQRQLVVARELTKMFEKIYRGTAEQILNNYGLIRLK